LYGIELRESGTGMVVELWGEFDIFSLLDLREALGKVSKLRRPTLVDLSGITFLDLQSAREFAVRSLLYARHLSFTNPRRRRWRASKPWDWRVGSTSAPTPTAAGRPSSWKPSRETRPPRANGREKAPPGGTGRLAEPVAAWPRVFPVPSMSRVAAPRRTFYDGLFA
jgi:hypothetical protein